MNVDLNLTTLAPGTIIAVRYSMYKHFAIVSDRLDVKNTKLLPMLISLSHRTGIIKEEPWNTVVGDKCIELSSISGQYSSSQVLSRARKCMNHNLRYNLLYFNCEHFVRYAHGLPMESTQVKQAFYGAFVGATTCLFLPKITLARFGFMVTVGAVTSLRNSLNKI